MVITLSSIIYTLLFAYLVTVAYISITKLDAVQEASVRRDVISGQFWKDMKTSFKEETFVACIVVAIAWPLLIYAFIKHRE